MLAGRCIPRMSKKLMNGSLFFFFFSTAFLEVVRPNHVISGTKKKEKVAAIMQVMLSFTSRSDNEYIKVVRERITSSPSAFSVGGV